jgi:NADPH:quinone reductase-like Zn-dependent oxidoreductase
VQKIVIHRPGGFNRLKIESFPDPLPCDDEVVVEIKAIGVNYADCVLRMGYYASAKEYVGWPISPGFDFSGIVSKLGKNVKDLRVGAPVFGISRFNSYATHVVVPRHQLFSIPKSHAFEETGGFPTIFLTAYYALHMVTKIFPNSTLLIHSAAGGVGSALLQLSRYAGWHTIGVVGSSGKVAAAKAMGADIVIDKSQENLWKAVDRHAPHGIDAVLDGNGYITLKNGAKRLRNNGKLIAYGFHSMFPKRRGVANIFKLAWDYLRTPRFNPISTHNRNISLITFNLSFMFGRKDLLAIAMGNLYKWFAEKKIRMPKITTYPFADAAKAHRDLQSGQTIGKLVLVH